MISPAIRSCLRCCAALLAALVLPGPQGVVAQTLDPSFHIPEIYQEGGISDAAQQADGHYVVAGSFTRANGQDGPGLARFDAAGTLDPVFQANLRGATLTASEVHPQADGRLLVLGSYQAGAIERKWVFRLQADGRLDASFNFQPALPGSFSAATQATVQPDGRILLLFSQTNKYSLLRLLPDGSPDPGFQVPSTTYTPNMRVLLLPDGKIVVGGAAWQATGDSLPYLARLNADGSPDVSFQYDYSSGRLSQINDLALDASGRLLVAGPVQNIVSGRGQPVFRLLPSGALDTSFALDASLPVRGCERLAVQPNGRLVALFDTYGFLSDGSGVHYPYNTQLVGLLPSGFLDSNFQQGSGPDNVLQEVRSLPGGQLLTWGSLHNFAGQRRTLVLLQPDGGLNLDFGPLLQQPGGIQKILRQADGMLVVQGNFNAVDGHLTDQVARLLADGRPDSTFAVRQPVSASTYFTATAVQRTGQVLVAGYRVSGDDVQYFLTRLAATGAADASFVPPLTLPDSGNLASGVHLLAEQADGKLLIGGQLTDAAGKANLTRLTANGSLDASFTPPVAEPVVQGGFLQADGKIVCVMLASDSVSYARSQNIQRLLPDGSPDSTFHYVPSTPFFDIGAGDVYPLPAEGYVAIGVYDDGQVMRRLAATGARVPGFATPFRFWQAPIPSYSGISSVIGLANGKLLVGGVMRERSGNQPSPIGLARLDASGNLDPDFAADFIQLPSATFTLVNDLLMQPDGKMLVGGTFRQAGGQPATGLVRLLDPSNLAAGQPHASSATPLAWPVPAHDALHLSFNTAAQPRRVMLLNMLGQPVLTQSVTQPALTLSTAGLTPGLYLLRVEYATGLATRTVAVE